VQTLYRRRERAEAEAARLDAAARAEWVEREATLEWDQRPIQNGSPFDPASWPEPTEWGQRPTDAENGLYYEVIAVELEGEA
jgi:hypothetical protein